MENGTIVTYVEQAFDTFAERELGAVDSLVLSCLSYLRLPDAAAFAPARGWEGMRLADLFRAEHFDALFGGMWNVAMSRRLLTACAASPRFRDLRVCGYTEQLDAASEKQFAAVAFAGTGRPAPDRTTPELFAYLAFRGTDATIVGWKEDFNMAFTCPVPAQEEAARYTDRAAARLPGGLFVGGHSKGGNLAVYAGARCGAAAQARVRRIFSHDGPGFMENVLAGDDFVRMAPLVEKTLPQSSLVGMLLEGQRRYQIVRSSRLSVWQHDPFSWEVDGTRFAPVDRLTPDAVYLDRTLSAWVAQMSAVEREQLVDTLFSLVRAGAGEGADAHPDEDLTFAQWSARLPQNLPALAHAVRQTDPAVAQSLKRMLKALFGLGAKYFPDVFHDGASWLAGLGSAWIDARRDKPEDDASENPAQPLDPHAAS